MRKITKISIKNFQRSITDVEEIMYPYIDGVKKMNKRELLNTAYGLHCLKKEEKIYQFAKEIFVE